LNKAVRKGKGVGSQENLLEERKKYAVGTRVKIVRALDRDNKRKVERREKSNQPEKKRVVILLMSTAGTRAKCLFELLNGTKEPRARPLFRSEGKIETKEKPWPGEGLW